MLVCYFNSVYYAIKYKWLHCLAVIVMRVIASSTEICAFNVLLPVSKFVLMLELGEFGGLFSSNQNFRLHLLARNKIKYLYSFLSLFLIILAYHLVTHSFFPN